MRIPIIMLTSRDLQKDKDLALVAGVEDFMVKTESFENVLKKIEETLENQSVMIYEQTGFMHD